jgi:hypothetical protein
MVSLTYERQRSRGISSKRPIAKGAARRDAGEQRGVSLPASYEPQPLPGSELPTTVYLLIIAAYSWMLGAAWYAFGRDTDAGLVLGIASVLAVVFFGIPIAMRKTAAPRLPRPQQTATRLRIATARVETATGTLPAWHAWTEVLLIPFALAIAATLIGAAYLSAA